MQPAKILSTSYQKNRAGKKILTCVAEIRKGQNVTAEYIQGSGEASRPVNGEPVVVTPREQTFGGYLAFGTADIVNVIEASQGDKIFYGRTPDGTAGAKITLNQYDAILQSANDAIIALSEEAVILNEGSGAALEADRLQVALDAFSASILAELVKIAALLQPKSPSNPYTPPASLPVDISAAKSETVNLP